MSGSMAPTPAPMGFRSPEPINPLVQFGQTTQILGGLSQLRRENETFGAQQVIGQAMQAATDPATGQINYQRFGELISGNPLAGFLAPQALAQASQLEQSRLQVQGIQAQLGMARLNNLRLSVQGLLANPNPTRDEVVREITNLLALPEGQRPFSAEVAAAQLATLPSDPAGIRRWLLQRMASTEQGVQQMSRFLPQPAFVNNGPTQTGYDTNPLSPTYGQRSGPSVVNAPGPSELNALTPGVGPNGQPFAAPRVNVAPMVDGAQQPVNPQQGQSPFGSGRYPTPQTPGAAAPGAAAPGGRAALPPGVPQGAFATGLPPGAPQAMEIEGAGAAQSSVALARQADRIPEMRASLQNMDNLIQQFNPGPMSGWTQTTTNGWNQILQGFGLPVLQAGLSNAAAQEEFTKQAYQIAQIQFQMLGGTGTNDQLASALTTSPNALLSRDGNRGIIALLRGNMDALEVKNKAWQEWQRQGNGPETYFQFEAQFNRNFNPRVFQQQYVTPEQRAVMFRNMSAADQDRYRRDWLYAVANGWIRVPDITPGVAARALNELPPAAAPGETRTQSLLRNPGATPSDVTISPDPPAPAQRGPGR